MRRKKKDCRFGVGFVAQTFQDTNRNVEHLGLGYEIYLAEVLTLNLVYQISRSVITKY